MAFISFFLFGLLSRFLAGLNLALGFVFFGLAHQLFAVGFDGSVERARGCWKQVFPTAS
jgi:hypothetical protein